jgi:hypothetical protein
MSKKTAYGVLAYVPTPGRLPQNDECHFDGWFTERSWAEVAFEDFCKCYPTAIVHIVTSIRGEWR